MVHNSDGQLSKSFTELPKAEQEAKLKDRLKKYSQKVYSLHPIFSWLILLYLLISRPFLQAYKRVLDKPVTEIREAGICMRENSFYVDTVRR